jgi:uncharacterized protein (TIGR02647 family)
MSLCEKQITDLELLLKFPTSSAMQGLKIHNDAPETLQDAARRLFERGITDRIDGGYLTELGHELQTHAFHLSSALK